MMLLPLTMLALTAPSPLPACQANQLSLGFDGENGAFDGMSQSGTLLVVRNIGGVACRMPGLPKLTLKDAQGHALPLSRKAPRGMHPGPVIVPAGIAPGAELTARLHWVSGPVYDHNRCYDVRYAAITLGKQSLQAPLSAHLCGEAGTSVTFDQAALHPDPRLD